MKKVMDLKKIREMFEILTESTFCKLLESVNNSECLEELDYHENQTNRNFIINCLTAVQKHGPTECPRIHHTEPKLGFRTIAIVSAHRSA